MSPVQIALAVLLLPLVSAALIALFLRRAGVFASAVSVLAATGVFAGALALALVGDGLRFESLV